MHPLENFCINWLGKIVDFTCIWIAEWEPWGVPDDYECEVIENDAPVPKHVPLHRPPPLPVEFHKTLEALTSSKSGKDTPAVSSSESPSKA